MDEIVAMYVLFTRDTEIVVKNFDKVTKTERFEEMGRTNVDLVFEILKKR